MQDKTWGVNFQYNRQRSKQKRESTRRVQFDNQQRPSVWEELEELEELEVGGAKNKKIKIPK